MEEYIINRKRFYKYTKPISVVIVILTALFFVFFLCDNVDFSFDDNTNKTKQEKNNEKKYTILDEVEDKNLNLKFTPIWTSDTQNFEYAVSVLDATRIMKISIPETYANHKVTAIRSKGFSSSRITSVYLSENIKNIDSYAFYNCSFLSAVYLNNGLESISAYVFSQCPSLTYITLPASVSQISYATFNQAKELTRIHVDATNNYFCSVDGVLYSKNKDILYRYPEGRIDSSYKVETGVSVIDICAFYNCSSIKNIDLPQTLKEIKVQALLNTSIKILTINSELEKIGRNVFPTTIEKIKYAGSKEQWENIASNDIYSKINGTYIIPSIEYNYKDGIEET